MDEPITYPMRINRYLYQKKICSRREADRLIEAGKVFVNGTPAVLGQQVQENDAVTVAKEVQQREYHYILYNKPPGIVSHNPQRDEMSVHDATGLDARIAVIGRLDKESRGLMLLSDDGRIVNTLLNPEYAHERVYEVTVDKYLKEQVLKHLARGVDIEGYTTKPAVVERLGDTRFSITLTEGKKHQIRRMCAALGYTVRDLARTHMLHLSLDIPEGDYRDLTREEVGTLLEAADMTTTTS